MTRYTDEIEKYVSQQRDFRTTAQRALDSARQDIEMMDRIAQITHDRINRASSLARLIGRWDAAEQDLVGILAPSPPPIPRTRTAA